MSTTDSSLESPLPEGYDPSSAPRYPVVRIDPNEGDDGFVRLDGEPLLAPLGADATDFLLDQCVEIAAARPTGDVRVAVTLPDGDTDMRIVHRSGQSWRVEELASTPTAQEKPSRGKRLVRLGLAGLLALGIVSGSAAGIYFIATDNAEATPTAETFAQPGESPVIPVWGYSRRANWVSHDVTTGIDAPLLVDENTVVYPATLDEGPAMVATEIDTGKQLWTKPLLGSSLTNPTQVTVGQTPAIAWASKKALYAIAADGSGEQLTVPIPKKSKMITHSGAPLMFIKSQGLAYPLHEGKLVERVVPASALPIHANQDGEVTAVDDDGHWWTLTARITAPSPNRLSSPESNAKPTSFVGNYDNVLLYLWQTRDAENHTQNILAAYDLNDDCRKLWSHNISGGSAPNVSIDPSATWGIAANLQFSVRQGPIRVLPDAWRHTRGINQLYAWDGQSPPQRVTATGELSAVPEVSKVRVAFPLIATSDVGLVIGRRDSAKQIYALMVDPGEPYPALPDPTLLPDSTTAEEDKED